MLAGITDIFNVASSAQKLADAITGLIKKRRGKARLLLEELKANHDLLVMVLVDGADHFKIIPELITAQYDALLQENFNLNELKKQKIQYFPKLEKSDLSHFIGKTTGFLLENIYDKIKALQRRCRLDKENPKINWRRRIINLHKRMVLLVDHLDR